MLWKMQVLLQSLLLDHSSFEPVSKDARDEAEERRLEETVTIASSGSETGSETVL